jgi:hypothetical protein
MLKGVMMQAEKRKRRTKLYFLLASFFVLAVGGVFAATSININNGVPISLGAGYSTATTCDDAVQIDAGQSYDSGGTNLFRVTSFTVSGVDITSGKCANKVLQLAVVLTNATNQQATWSLASSSATNYSYKFGPTGDGSVSGGTSHNASIALTPFDIATLSTVALSIS